MSKNINRKEFLDSLCKEFSLTKKNNFTKNSFLFQKDITSGEEDLLIEFIPAGKYFFTIYVSFITEDKTTEKKIIKYIKKYFNTNKIDKKIVLHFTGYWGDEDIFLNFNQINK